MDVAVLLLLPLVGGFIFSSSFNPTRYLASREEGHRLYFRAAFFGLGLFVVVVFLRQWLKADFEFYRALEGKLRALLAGYLKDAEKPYAFDLTIVAVESVLISWPLAKLCNFFYWKGPALARAIKHDDFEQLLNEAVSRTLPIALSMSSRKVYVGFVMQTFDPAHDRKWIKILPLVSGYRDKDNLQIQFVTNYHDAYGRVDPAQPDARLAGPLRHLAPKDFGIVLPVDNIESANLFDLEAYKRFKTGRVGGGAAPNVPAAGLRRARRVNAPDTDNTG